MHVLGGREAPQQYGVYQANTHMVGVSTIGAIRVQQIHGYPTTATNATTIRRIGNVKGRKMGTTGVGTVSDKAAAATTMWITTGGKNETMRGDDDSSTARVVRRGIVWNSGFGNDSIRNTIE